MRSLLKHLSRVGFLITCSTVICQAQNIDSLLTLQHQADPQEKMFVHFDKNYYSPGETIWFKAYLFTGLNRSVYSKNFYAELRDEKGILLDKKTAPVLFSGAASNFDLPDSFPKSSVIFRAYTTTMLNGDTSFLYVKPIHIIHQIKKNTATKPVAPVIPVTRFLPEGGDLVAGLPCKVAFKTTGANDEPVESQGVIKDPDGKELVSFSAVHDGMGSFTITPEAGKNYTAVWKDNKGKAYTTALPPVKDKGILLHVSDAPGAKKYAVTRQPDAGEAFQTLNVIGIMNQQLIYQARLNLVTKENVAALMPVNELPSGILQVTIFDKYMQPLAERVCFVNNGNYEFDADAWISDLNIGKRELNRAEVKILDSVATNLSISITDADLDVPEPLHDNIVTRMLLTGDLRGKIHKPYFYFYSTADSTPHYLDLVMLTNGWRRYNWENVLAGKVPETRYTENNYLGIKGKLVNAQGNVFAPGTQLNGIMQTTDSASNFISLPIERNGAVSIDGMVFYDSAKLYLQYNDKNKEFEPAMFNVNNGLIPNTPSQGLADAVKLSPYQPDSLVAARYWNNNVNELKIAAKKFKDAHELQNVTVTARLKTAVEKLDEEYASAMFSGDAKGFDVMGDPSAVGSFSIFQYLQGKVAGLQISTGGASPQLSWRGGTPVIYLNEMRSDVSMIQSINMADIAYIKVFNPSSAGVISSTGGGVISIYTKKGSDASSSVPSKLKALTLLGYSPIKEFFAPDYAAASSADGFYENLGTTLYWNPYVLLDNSNKRFKFQFFNNDITKSFRIVLEGISNSGKLIHVEKVIPKN